MIKTRHQWPNGTHCAYCDRPLEQKGIIKTKDHVIPISKGGFNDIRNYVCACLDCNQLKANKHIAIFAQSLFRIRYHHKMYVYRDKMMFNAWKIYNKMGGELQRILKQKQ